MLNCFKSLILGLVVFQSANALAITFPKNFVFGVANAPAQTEDGLDDIWSDWAKKGHMHAWSNDPNPNERIQFWNKPSVEVGLAQDLGVGAFRMGIDWGRVMPTRTTIDIGALHRYRDTIRLIKSKNMKVMLTLWHHDVPKWVQDSGGWHSDENKAAFEVFAKKVITELNGDVDWFVTFNEANVFVTMAYTLGAWPPGEVHSPTALMPILCGSSVGAMDRMAEAHNDIYEWAHQQYPSIKIGLAHNMANYKGASIVDNIATFFADSMMNWRLPNLVAGHMDFFGMNYYGSEWFKGGTITFVDNQEYSDAGRAIDVNGLFTMLQKIDRDFHGLPILLTENGTADAGDTIKAAYTIEHLHAIHKAIQTGIPVAGYFIWTLTDNLEWSDGYCPKFGLVGVNRKTFERIPRPSYYVYKEIATSHEVTDAARTKAWQQVVSSQGHDRSFCRGADGGSSLDVPRIGKFTHQDWRFKDGPQ